MLNLIANNPYRVLGVYANATKREILSNKSKSNALLNVGRAVEFPLDFKESGLLPSLDRTMGSITAAEACISIPKEQIKHAQFWFLKATPIDDVAFNHLIAGDISQAKEIWSKKESLSSLQNKLIVQLLEGRWKFAFRTADKLYAGYGDGFLSALGITTVQMTSSDLLHQFIDVLAEELGMQQVLDHCVGLSFESYLKSNAISPLITRITEEVNNAKKIDHTNAVARNQAGHKLIKVANESLQQLKKLLPENDPQYQIVADKLGLEILQCGIDFFKNSTGKNASYAALEFLKRARSIVVGNIAKQRCEENIENLQKIIDELPPDEVLVEDKAIRDEIEKCIAGAGTIAEAIVLLNKTKPHLQKIKTKLGKGNAYYLSMSTLVAKVALHNLIDEVNSVQEDDGSSMSVTKMVLINSTVRKAWEATIIMDTFDLEDGFSSHYIQNRITLKSLCNSLGISTYTSTSSTHSASRATVSPRPSNTYSSLSSNNTTQVRHTPTTNTTSTQNTPRSTSKPTAEPDYFALDFKNDWGLMVLIVLIWGVVGWIIEKDFLDGFLTGCLISIIPFFTFLPVNFLVLALFKWIRYKLSE